MTIVEIERKWQIVNQIGGGGFGNVFKVVSGTEECALKLVPKVPGAERELLFVDLNDAVNVVPIIEFGETKEAWAMIMPLAECSLRDKIVDEGIPFDLDEAIGVLLDICAGLESISSNIVHRDIKPENILLLEGNWCLADFGIARYAEATTEPETRKHAMTAPYAAPERWLFKRATSATDVYAVGVVAYEILAGHLPFEGPSYEDFREQHLYAQPRSIKGLPTGVTATIEECLYKPSQARPSPSNLIARLTNTIKKDRSEGRGRLINANLHQIRERAKEERERAVQEVEAEHRGELYKVARSNLSKISQSLLGAICEDATAAEVTRGRHPEWAVCLGQAELILSSISPTGADPWGDWEAPAFEVIDCQDIMD